MGCSSEVVGDEADVAGKFGLSQRAHGQRKGKARAFGVSGASAMAFKVASQPHNYCEGTCQLILTCVSIQSYEKGLRLSLTIIEKADILLQTFV